MDLDTTGLTPLDDTPPSLDVSGLTPLEDTPPPGPSTKWGILGRMAAGRPADIVSQGVESIQSGLSQLGEDAPLEKGTPSAIMAHGQPRGIRIRPGPGEIMGGAQEILSAPYGLISPDIEKLTGIPKETTEGVLSFVLPLGHHIGSEISAARAERAANQVPDFLRTADEVDARLKGAKSRAEIDEFIRNKDAERAAAETAQQKLLPAPETPVPPAPPVSGVPLADSLRERLGLTQEAPPEEPLPEAAQAAIEASKEILPPTPEEQAETPPEKTPETLPAVSPDDAVPVRSAPKPRNPLSISQFIARNGGLELSDETKGSDYDKVFVPGGGPLARKSGLSIDGFWRQKLMEEGYLPYDPDGGSARDVRQELHDALDADLSGNRFYSENDRDRVQEIAEQKAQEPDIESAAKEILAAHEREGIGPDQIDTKSLYDAAELLVRGEEKDPIDALERAYLQEYHSEIDTGNARASSPPTVGAGEQGKEPGPEEAPVIRSEDRPSPSEGGQEKALDTTGLTPADPVWNAIADEDAKLSGEAGRAIDEWVGGPHDSIKQGITSGLMIPARLEGMPDADLEQMAQPIRKILRDAYGESIPAYRADVGGQPSSGRVGKLYSYTTNRKIAEWFAGVRKDVPLIPEDQISAAEQELAKTGEVTIGRRTFRAIPGYSSVDMFDQDDNHITDAPSVRAELESINKDRSEINAKNAEARASVREYNLPVDSVVWATDRFNQKELIARPPTESTPAGEQAVIPGAEQISQGELAQRKADEGLKPTVPQKAADVGLFGDERNQTDLMDLVREPPKEAANGLQDNVPPSSTGVPPGGVQAPVEERPTDARSGNESAPSPESSGPANQESSQVPTAERGSTDTGNGESPTSGLPSEPRDDGQPGRDAVPVLGPAASVTGENHVIAPGSLGEDRGWSQKAKDNVRAIELVKQIEEEARPATREEQEELAKYVGWGGLKNAFPDGEGKFGKGFEAIGKRLQELLPPDEYATARRSIQYAHYTAEPVVRAMWSAVQRMGFKGGQVFEPGMGIGNFAGMMPGDISSNTHYVGLEYDKTTARIAKLLYPKWGVMEGDFTKSPLPENGFDLAIGNPPFADTVIKSDPKYANNGFFLHDYFFAKSLDGVKPGGVVSFISSAGTMNKVDPKARQYLADRADLIGAIRLPSNAFKKNAGTEVTTDIIFLRKRLPADAPGDRSWTEVTPVQLPDNNGNLVTGNNNKYFADHPEMVLGNQGWFDKLYEGRYAVHAREGQDLAKDLAEAINRLPQDVFNPETTEAQPRDFSTAEKKDGSFYVGPNGKLYQMSGGAGIPVARRGSGVSGGKSSGDFEKIRGLIPVRDALRDVYAADLGGDVEGAEKARTALNKAYDDFVEKFGPINKAEIQRRRPTIIQEESARNEAREEARYAGENFDEGTFDPTDLIRKGATTTEVARARKAARESSPYKWSEGSFDPTEIPDVIIDKRPNIDPFMDDPESYRLRAIEKYDEATGKGSKSRVFTENVISKPKPPEIKSVGDAVLHVLNQTGRLDIPEISKLIGKTESEVIDELGDRIFREPGTQDTWSTRESYLSGNVRKKLDMAKAMATKDPSFKRNVEALEAAQPTPIPPTQIHAGLGMPWIPRDTIEEFGKNVLGLESLKARYVPALAQWIVSGDTDSVAALATWGTERRRAPMLISDALNRQNPKIYDTWKDSEGTHSELNIEATQAAQEKVQAIKAAFEDWVWKEPERSDRLSGLYNEKYNNIVNRQYDGSYLTTPGVSTTWSWRPHQTRVIARIIESGNTYMAHAVGAGKTSAMIGAGMEMRRLGLVRKPMYAVPNHMLAQFTKEFYEQYPTAKIAVADERQFHTDRRKQFVANVANDDLDAVIITHSAFGKIPISDEFSDKVIQNELQEYRELLDQISNDRDNRITRSRIEKQIERLEQRLSGKGNKRTDQVFNFEEMGIDHLFVDEAHLFRKLDFSTNMGGIKGISPEGSQMSWDLYVKSLYLDQQSPGRSLVLASGTPVTNTMAELHTVSRYLQRQELRDRGLEKFDAWAGAFGDTKTELEQDAAGGYKPVTRFSRFVNVPELSSMVRQVMDVVTSRQLEKYVVRPTLKDGKRSMNLAEKSPALETYQQRLAARMKAISERKGPPKPGDDIMLSVINDGRHAAIDMRLVDRDYKPSKDEKSKLDLLVDNVYRIYGQTTKQEFHSVVPDRSNSGEPIMMYSNKPVSTGPATQMIFANLGISGSRGFSVPDYIRSELSRRGIPKDEIAFISNYKTHVAKQKLFNDMNEGKVRILIGSTAKMATGVNAQRRLYAIHNMDPLWYPSDDEQRIGRALRQGNMNPKIEIHDYSTKGTYDSTMWGMMGRKAKFIQAFFEGDPTLRDMDDLGEASQYEQAKAITTNDPRLIELTELKQELEKAGRRQAAFETEQYTLKGRRADAKRSIDSSTREIARVQGDIKQRQDISGDKFKASVLGTDYTKRADWNEGLSDTKKKLSTPENKGKTFPLAEIGGFQMYAKIEEYINFGNKTKQYVPDTFIRLTGGRDRTIRDSANTSQSVEAILRNFEKDIENENENISKNKKFIADSEDQAKATFQGGPQIKELTQKVKDLEEAMSAPPDATPEADPKLYSMEELNKLGQMNTPEAMGKPGQPLILRRAPTTEEMSRVASKEHLRQIVRNIVGKAIKVEFGDDIEHGTIGWDAKTPSKTVGLYSPLEHLITLAMGQKDIIHTAFHEAWHAVEDHFATPAEIALMKHEEPALKKMAEKDLGHKLDGVSDYEIRAEAFSAYAKDRASGIGLSYGIRTFFNKILNLLRRVRNSIQGIGFKTSDDLFKAAYEGETKGRPSQMTGAYRSRLTNYSLREKNKNNPANMDKDFEDLAQFDKPKRAMGGRVEEANIAEPTPAQAKAGNYSKDHIHIHGLNISIENAKGSYRKGIGKDGKPWKSKLPAHYGYIKRTKGADGDHVDCYIGPHIRSPNVYIIDQLNEGKFDEHKCYIGFPSKFAAINAFHEAFSDGKAGERFGHVREMTIVEFKEWLEHGNTKHPVRYKAAA